LASSSTSSIKRPVTLLMAQLAACSPDEWVIEAQEIFSAVAVEKKVGLVISYEPEILQAQTIMFPYNQTKKTEWFQDLGLQISTGR
jgi:hypothetical protein